MRPTLNLDFANGKVIDPRITVSRASSAMYTGADGIRRIAQPNEMRIDHDPVTGECKGVLIEGASTNLLMYSEQFDNAAWTKTRSSVTSNATTAPDGTLTADKLVEDSTASSSHYVGVAPSVTSGSIYTLSVFAKAGERTVLTIQFANQFAANFADFNLVTGEIITKSGLSNAAIDSVGGGWYRCSISASATVSAPATMVAYINNGTSVTYTGDGTSGLYIWGAQLEVGSAPTSYMPTTSAQATRSADLMSMTGKNFSDWYNPGEGTFVCEAVLDDTNMSSTPVLMGVCSDGYSNTMYLSVLSGTSVINAYIVANSIDYTNGALSSTINKGKPFCVAMSYKKNNVAYCVDGATVLIDSTAEIPNATQMGIGKAPWGGSNYLNGHIKRLTYYPKRLSNTELQALTR